MGNHRLSPEEVGDIIRLRHAGLSYVRIACTIGHNRATVMRICQRAGMNRRSDSYEVEGTHYEHISDDAEFGLYIKWRPADW